MLNKKILILSKNIVTPIGHAILDSIKNQIQDGANEFIIGLDLDDTITKSSPEYGGRAIVAEYKKVAKEKYNIEFVIKPPISSIEDVRIGMQASGLSDEQIKDIEKTASKNYKNNNVIPELTTNFPLTIRDMKYIKREFGNKISYNIITNREKHIGKNDIENVEKVHNIDFDRIIYAKGLNRKPSADIFFDNFDSRVLYRMQKGTAAFTMIGDTANVDGGLVEELLKHNINAKYIFVENETNRNINKCDNSEMQNIKLHKPQQHKRINDNQNKSKTCEIL